jgi:hypothetical protein
MEMSLSATALSSWPEDHLRRVWRLTAAGVRQLHASSHAVGPDLDRIERQAAAIGGELVRRGLI